MNPFKELDYLVQARVFTKEILGELKYNNNKDEVFPIVKKKAK